MKPLTLSQDLTIRLLIATLFITVAWAATGLILERTKGDVLSQLSKSATYSASYIEQWLSEKSHALDALTEDARLLSIQDIQPNSRLYPLPLRQALYEFSVLQKRPNVYLVAPQFAAKSFNTTNAVPLPEDVNNWLQGLLKTETRSYIRLVTIKNEDFILVADTFKNPETSEALAYTVYMEPLSQALLTLKLPRFNQLGAQYKVPLFNRSDVQTVHGYPNLNAQTSKVITRLLDSTISSFFRAGAFSGKTTFFGTDLMGTQQLLLFPDWYVAVSVPASFVQQESGPFRTIILALAALCGLAILLWPTQGGWTIFIRGYADNSRQKSGRAPGAHINYATFKKRPTFKELSTFDDTRSKSRIKVIGRQKTPEMALYEVIKESLDLHRTKLLYQAIFDAKTNDIIMYEVYLRILNEEGEVLSPAEFLPIAERFGFLPDIDNYVISRITELHLNTSNPPYTFAVNLSGNTFESISFLETLMHTLDRKNAPHMVLELRSNEIIKDPDAMAFIDKCRVFGCPFSIDYFGGGESMIQASSRLKFSYVKLDCQVFEKNTSTKKELIKLSKKAQELGISLVLEKIETQDMADFARTIGIPYLQGFYLAKPAETID